MRESGGGVGGDISWMSDCSVLATGTPYRFMLSALSSAAIRIGSGEAESGH